ncbi:hypothetical protein [Janthinobacterium sp. J1-1]|uniref:hypothetical protein n=1 Tax=Janthinobacterium sp. J1-1 TaxID=3065910 RepID=UPI0028117986|nr:hypothetical protein [Janthinobacterium sp. J1-1]
MTRFLIFLVFALAALSASAQTVPTACGGSSQPRCEVNMAADSSMTTTEKAYKDNRTSWDDYSKSFINTGMSFQWSFIPNIPTAVCVNPRLDNPSGTASVEMDVCGPFNVFMTFINGVLAFFCLLGCVQQIRGALAA